MHVLEASVVVEVLLRTPLGIRHIDHVVNTDESVHVPHLLDLEVLQVIRRLTLAGELDTQHSVVALNALIDLPLVRHQHMPLLHLIWELRTALTAYDAAYIALAKGLSAVLLTCDGRLARAQGHRARVNLLT